MCIEKMIDEMSDACYLEHYCFRHQLHSCSLAARFLRIATCHTSSSMCVGSTGFPQQSRVFVLRAGTVFDILFAMDGMKSGDMKGKIVIVTGANAGTRPTGILWLWIFWRRARRQMMRVRCW